MPDIAHFFGDDLAFSPTGDLAVVDGPDMTLQRLLRRLLTNQGDAVWQPEFGAGLPGMVGSPADAPRIEGIARRQLAMEDSVAQSPPPRVRVEAKTDGTVTLLISYTDAPSGELRSLTVPLGA